MKGICISSSDDEAFFKIESKDKPSVNKTYVFNTLVDKGTAQQNRTFHPLLECLYDWMLSNDKYQFEVNGVIYDFRCDSVDRLKRIFKIRYGKGACSWKYVTDQLTMALINDLNDVPDYVLEDFNNGNRGRIEANEAISWTLYEKDDRRNLIDRLISIMHLIKVDSKRFFEILEGFKI